MGVVRHSRPSVVSAHCHLVRCIIRIHNLVSNEVLFASPFSLPRFASVASSGALDADDMALKPNNPFKPRRPLRGCTSLLIWTTRESSSTLRIPAPTSILIYTSLSSTSISSSSSVGEPPNSQSNIVHLLHLAIDGRHPAYQRACHRRQLIPHCPPRELNLHRRSRSTAPPAKFNFLPHIAVHQTELHGHANIANAGRMQAEPPHSEAAGLDAL